MKKSAVWFIRLSHIFEICQVNQAVEILSCATITEKPKTHKIKRKAEMSDEDNRQPSA